MAGIDLSLTSTGLACVGPGAGGIVLRRVKSKGSRADTTADRYGRLREVTGRIVEVVTAFGAPDLVVIEGPAFSRSNPGMHDRSGLWWLVYDALASFAPIAEVPPTSRAKYATGRGNAGKDEVLAAVVRRYLQAPVSGNDEADALVLAAMGSRHLGCPIDDMPKAHLEAMDKLTWPQVGSSLTLDAFV